MSEQLLGSACVFNCSLCVVVYVSIHFSRAVLLKNMYRMSEQLLECLCF